jgi:hypothetical protein
MVDVRTPVLQATLSRRLLIAFRLAPEASVYLVPAPFSLLLVNGFAVGCLSLDRVTALRPRGLPAATGLTFEHAAHRIAVEWDQGGRAAHGFFVVARHGSSRLIAGVGDRLFPGANERAAFAVADHGPELRVAFESSDGRVCVDASVVAAAHLSASELFASTDEAWRFFRRGAVSYSLRRHGGLLDGLDARTKESRVQAAAIERVSSSVFGPDIAVADSALLMRDVSVEWRALPPPR